MDILIASLVRIGLLFLVVYVVFLIWRKFFPMPHATPWQIIKRLMKSAAFLIVIVVLLFAFQVMFVGLH